MSFRLSVKRKEDPLQNDEFLFEDNLSDKSFKKQRTLQEAPWYTAQVAEYGDADMLEDENSSLQNGELNNMNEFQMNDGVSISDNSRALILYKDQNPLSISNHTVPYNCYPSVDNAPISSLSVPNFNPSLPDRNPLSNGFPSLPTDSIDDPTVLGSSRRLNSCYPFAGLSNFPTFALNQTKPMEEQDSDNDMECLNNESQNKDSWAIVPWNPSNSQHIPLDFHCPASSSCSQLAYMKDNGLPFVKTGF